MRYISKNIISDAASLLDTWNRSRRRSGEPLIYDRFPNKEELNGYLRDEQKGICCYCQQPITHFQGNNNGGSHNEHLFPQKTRADLQTNHGNIFACCNYSKGMKKDQQHCGEAKGEKEIFPFIKWVSCNQEFKYNTLGEIIPQGKYNQLEEFKDNVKELTDKQKEALNAIQILNLNKPTLVLERKKDQTKLFKILLPLTEGQIRFKIAQLCHQNPYSRFIDMQLYFMNLRIKKLL